MNNIKKFQYFSIFILVVWTLAILFSMFSSLQHIVDKEKLLALSYAKNTFEKNLIFRQWVAMHGGVYVFPTEKTPPNPYLKHIPNRDLTTTNGLQLTLMNPAYTLRELMENFSGPIGEKSHITSLKLINPNNKADHWERNVLKRFDKKEFEEFYEIYKYKGSEHLRYMKALKVETDCLKCHSHQGYKIGDTRGGISITVPMKKYNENAQLEKNHTLVLYISIFIFSLIFGILIYIKTSTSLKKELHFQEKLKEKERILYQQSKMASLGEMLQNISHQWRQPLSAIATSASGLKVTKETNTLDDKFFYETLDGILTSTEYLSQTIEDFSNFIKDNKEKVIFNLSQNIDKNLIILSGSLKNHDIEVIKKLDKELEVHSFPNELTQVFINIVHNAKDAFKDRDIKKRYLFISLKQEKNNIVISIKDNAQGIKKNIIGKIFDPYFTTKHKSQGTGLGLYMSHNIVHKSLLGTITAKNIKFDYKGNTYKGVEFRITLPLHLV